MLNKYDKSSRKIINFEDISKMGDMEIIGDSHYHIDNYKDEIKFKKYVKDQEKFFYNSLVFKFLNLRKFDLNKFISNYIKNKMIFQNNLWYIDLFSLINVILVTILYLILIILLQVSDIKMSFKLLDNNFNLNNYITYMIPSLIISYNIYFFGKYFLKLIFNVILGFLFVFFLIFLIRNLEFKNNFSNAVFLLLLIYLIFVNLISIIQVIINKLLFRLFDNIIGIFWNLFGTILLFVYIYLVFRGRLSESNYTLLIVTIIYVFLIIFKLSYEVCFFKNNHYDLIINYLKNKKNINFFKFNFVNKYVNEFYHSLLPILCFILLVVNFLSLLIYTVIKINTILINQSTNINIIQISFIRREFEIYILNIIISIVIMVSYILKNYLKNRNTLFLINKLFLVIVFILVFNSNNIFSNRFLSRFLDSNALSIYFIINIIFISFIPMISLKYVNLVNSIKFGILLNYTIFNLYFLSNKTAIPLVGIIIILIISYIPLIIITIKFIFSKNIIDKIKNKNNTIIKNKFFILIWSYFYDIILIFISVIYFNKLSLGSINNINFIFFIYCFIMYILWFTGSLIKFKENFNLREKLLVTNLLNKDTNSKILYNFVNLTLFFIYIIMLIISYLINVPYSYFIVTFYSLYVCFIWIVFKNFILILKKKFKLYLIFFNLTVFVLFTIVFCFVPSLIFNIYINSSIIGFNKNLVNLFLFSIIICFLLWSILISVTINLFISKIEYEKMVQYINLNLKLDCFKNLIYADIEELRALVDYYFDFKKENKNKNKLKFQSRIENGEFLIWWDYNRIKNYKKKLILKENLEIFLKTLDEKYKKDKSFFEKLFCIKSYEYNKIIENNNKNLTFDTVINQFNAEKKEKFIKDDKIEVISDEEEEEFEEIEEKTFNFSLFGNILWDKMKNKKLKEEKETKKVFKNLFLNVNKNLETENIQQKYKNKLDSNELMIKNLNEKKLKLDEQANLEYVKRKEDINNGKKENIDEQLELYRNKDKLFEILKTSEEQRNFFLYLIYKNCSSSNNNKNNGGISLTYTSFINFLKKVKMHNYFISNYKINIFKKDIVDLKKLFVELSSVKRGELTNNELQKLKKQESIKLNFIRQIGIDFKSFIIFYKEIANKFSQNIENYSLEPYTKLILETYSLCKFCLYDFEKIIKEIDLDKFRQELLGKINEKKENNKKKLLDELEEIKKNKEKFINEEKMRIDKQITDLMKQSEILIKDKNKDIKNIRINYDINDKVDDKPEEIKNKIDVSDIFQTKKILKKKKKSKNTTTNNISDNNINDDILDINSINNDIILNTYNNDKDAKNSNNKYLTACLCFKYKSRKNKSLNNIEVKKENEKNLLLKLFYNLGLKDPNDVISESNIKQWQKVPENWKIFSNYLIDRLETHSINYENIIYNSSILLNMTNIIFILTRIINVYKSYTILYDSTYPWFKDNLNQFNENESVIFYNTFGFKFGVSFGYSIVYFFISLYAYQFIKKGTLGIDQKTGKSASFPHVQFLISLYITIGESLISYCVRNLSGLFVCNIYNNNLNGYVTIISNNFLCLSNIHFLYLFLAFFGLIGFFFFALIFWPNFQFYETLLDIKFYAYYIILDLFFEGFLIIIENFIDWGFKTWSGVILLSILDIVVILIKIFIIYFYKPCIISGFNYFEIIILILETFPSVCTIILYFTRNSIASLIVLLVFIFIYFLLIIIYLCKKFKEKKNSKNIKNKEKEEKIEIENKSEKKLEIKEEKIEIENKSEKKLEIKEEKTEIEKKSEKKIDVEKKKSIKRIDSNKKSEKRIDVEKKKSIKRIDTKVKSNKSIDIKKKKSNKTININKN